MSDMVRQNTQVSHLQLPLSFCGVSPRQKQLSVFFMGVQLFDHFGLAVISLNILVLLLVLLQSAQYSLVLLLPEAYHSHLGTRKFASFT